MAGLSATDLQAAAAAPLFAALKPEELGQLLDQAVAVSHPENSLLFSQGDDADHFFRRA